MSSDARYDRQAWAERYKMCLLTDRHNSERRWRAVAGLAEAHATLEAEAEASEPDPDNRYGLDADALEWLQILDYAKMFRPKVQS